MIAFQKQHTISSKTFTCSSLVILGALSIITVGSALHAQESTQAPLGPKTMPGHEDNKTAVIENIPLWRKLPDRHHVDDDFYVLGGSYGSSEDLRTDKPMVIRFKSMDELIHYSRGKLNHTDAQIDRIVERISPKIDFSKSDLVIAYQGGGGPPFGNFVHELKDGKLQFRLHKEESKFQHLALGYQIELFRIPKGMEVEEKNTKRGDGQ